MSDQAQSGRQRLGAWALLALSAAMILMLLGIALFGFVGEGLHLNALRSAREAHTVTMHVDQIRERCGRSCVYDSFGWYVEAASGQIVSDVKAVPSFDEPAHGPLQVIVSPGHTREAVRADYTGAGKIAAGLTLTAPWALCLLVLALSRAQARRRRAQVRHVLEVAAAGGAQPTLRFHGILRGPGIPRVIGESPLELTGTELVEYEHLPGADRSWRVDLREVSDLCEDVPLDLGTTQPEHWRSLAFRTPAGAYTLTCDPIYLPVLRVAFESAGQ